MRASYSRIFSPIYLILLAALISALPAQGSAETKKTTITVMKPGDLWLDDVQYTKVARGQRDGTWGYDVTYVVPGIGEKVLFWPRSKIDLDGSAPNKYRIQFMPRGKGRLLLPDRITTRSLPEVYRAILLLEGSYTKEARGNMVVAEAFATVTGLAAGLPGRAAGVASRPAASSAATRAPIKPTAAKLTVAKPTVAKPTAAKPTAANSGFTSASTVSSSVEKKAYFTGRKSAGAAAATTRTGVKGLLKDVGLPHTGKIRFVPRPDAATQGLLKGPGGRGFVDKFGNVWVRPRGQIVGEAHWDVQLSAMGKKHLGWTSRSGSHINVSIDGRIVH